MNIVVVEGSEIVPVEGDPNERLQAGSISKAISALTALRLVAVGALDLDADVNGRLESWRLPEGDGVTLRRLLGHTAGLGVPFFPGYADGEPVPTLVQVLDGEPPASGTSTSGAGKSTEPITSTGPTPKRRLKRPVTSEPSTPPNAPAPSTSPSTPGRTPNSRVT